MENDMVVYVSSGDIWKMIVFFWGERMGVVCFWYDKHLDPFLQRWRTPSPMGFLDGDHWPGASPSPIVVCVRPGRAMPLKIQWASPKEVFQISFTVSTTCLAPPKGSARPDARGGLS